MIDPRPAPAHCKRCGAGMPHDLANCVVCGRARELGAGEVFYTVPWCPEAEGEELRGGALRAIHLAAKLARERGWSAEALRRRPVWNLPTFEAACVRAAVRLGLIP